MGLHDCASHPAGTRACYVSHKCRCVDCTGANLEYYHEWNRARLEREHGSRQSKYVEADVPRRTLARIRAAGIGLRTISKRTGLSRSSMRLLAMGERQRVLKSTARLLAEVASEELTT